ncbi:MAG: hypothetical protein HY553_13035 [Elusimicrobia bacterium]|nr:hypothetical protein [Elusimicrobiota bacterium]
MENRRRRIFIDGKEYAGIDEVPPELRARVEQQLQGKDAEMPEPASFRRQVKLSGQTRAKGDGPAAGGFLIMAGIGLVGFGLLLYIIGC